MFLKRKQLYKRQFQCPECERVWESYVTKNTTEIGRELYADGGVDALENFFFVLKNRIIQEIEKDPSPMRSLWNGLTDEWQY